MISAAARLSLVRSTAIRAPRALSVLGGSRTMAIGDQLSKKEKVEEDRYIRKVEKEMMERHKQAANGDPELEKAMNEAAGSLAESNDSVSQEAIMKLAKWKLGRK